MDKETKKKLHALDPRFRKKIERLLEEMNESISILYEAASKDEKTNLYNSKFFDNILEMEIEKAQRGKQKLSLLAIDIDHFKKLNDTHGHLKGDEILVELGKLLKKQMRRSDIVSRFGGEEFFILMPETSITKAKKAAKRLQNAIKKNKKLSKYNLTVSGGLTQYIEKDTKKRFMERADKALYKAKKSGRDKFVFN